MGNNNRSNFNTDTAGVVEIANIRRAFYTPTYGTPDLLFSWLLNSARDALEFTGGGQHQKKETVGHKPTLLKCIWRACCSAMKILSPPPC